MEVNDLQQQVCKNCGHSFTASFCNKCGQKEAHRITIIHVFHDLVHVFLHADKGVFAFIPRLILTPGIIAREFIEGKRKVFNPFQYLIISVGVTLFLLLKSHFYDSLREYNSHESARLPGHFNKALLDFTGFIQSYANIITLLVLPIFALFSWIVFKRKGNNYAEHVTIQVFATSQINTINAIVLLACIILKVSGFATRFLSIALTIVCFTMTYKQFYNLKWHISFWKAVIVFATSYVVQVALMGIGLVTYIMILKSRH